MLDVASFGLEVLKALDWDFGGAGAKMKKIGSHLLVEGSDNFPKPFDNGIARHVALVISVFFPILNIYCRPATENHLELMWLKDFQEIVRNDLIESVLHALNDIANLPISVELDPKLNRKIT